MKYLVEDTDNYTLGELHEHIVKELKKTNLVKEDIRIADSLAVKMAMLELERIFDENGLEGLYTIELGCIHLIKMGNIIEFSKSEISACFEDRLSSLIDECLNK